MDLATPEAILLELSALLFIAQASQTAWSWVFLHGMRNRRGERLSRIHAIGITGITAAQAFLLIAVGLFVLRHYHDWDLELALFSLIASQAVALSSMVWVMIQIRRMGT